MYELNKYMELIQNLKGPCLNRRANDSAVEVTLSSPHQSSAQTGTL